MTGNHNPCELTVEVRLVGADLVLQPAGELDLATVPQLQRALEQAPEDFVPRVVLDLAELSFMDASGLQTIIEANERLAGRLVLRGGQPQVRRIFEITGVTDQLTFEDSGPRQTSSDADANLDYVRRMWEAFRTGGAAAFAEMVPEHVDWRPWQARGRILHGRRELREFWSSGELATPVTASFTALGESILVRCEYPMPGGSHKEIWSLYRFEGRRLTQAASFDQKVDALSCAA